MENCILQNNAINIYQHYFSDVEPTPLVERSSARTVNVYHDQSTPARPVTHISWSPDNQTKLAVSHCNLSFQAVVPNQSTHSYIWEVGSFINLPKGHSIDYQQNYSCINFDLGEIFKDVGFLYVRI